MVKELSISDPVSSPKEEKFSAFNRFFLQFIIDPRDIVFVHLIIKLFLLVIPFTLYCFTANQIIWWLPIVYLFVNWALFMGPFILMLHCTSHRRLFKQKHNWMNNIIPWVLGPFFGESPETYFTHHMGMHHPENNLENDLSSTMSYQRDCCKDFTKYFLKFFFLVIPDLSQYFIKKKRTKLLKRTLIGESSWFIMAIILGIINLQATLFIFLIPFCFTRLMMMAGNWAQHAFIDANEPGNCYRNSITCINSHYNKQCFNDGYHIVHHIKPHIHYTEMPGEFMANRQTYAKEKAVVFEGIDFFMVWIHLMTKNYKRLAKQFVHLDDTYKNDEDVINFLKTRTAKI